MRSIKKLLELTLIKFKSYSYTGICQTVYYLEEYKEISLEEYYLLEDYLRENKPSNTSLNSFWWPPYDKEPRIEWLENQIAKL